MSTVNDAANHSVNAVVHAGFSWHAFSSIFRRPASSNWRKRHNDNSMLKAETHMNSASLLATDTSSEWRADEEKRSAASFANSYVAKERTKRPREPRRWDTRTNQWHHDNLLQNEMASGTICQGAWYY